MRCHNHLVSAALILAAVLLGSLLSGIVQAEAILVGYWNLDEGTGTTAADSTSPASDGTLATSPNTPTWTTGYLNGGLSFDGTSSGDRVLTANTAELDLTGDLTIDFWMKPLGKGNNNYGPLVGKNGSGGQSYDAYFVDIAHNATGVQAGGDAAEGKIEFGITYNDANVVLRSASVLSYNTDWYHIRCEYVAGDRMTIYINDVKDSEKTTGVPTACDLASNGLAMGTLTPGGNPTTSTYNYSYKGLLDEVRVYEGVVPEPGCLVLLGSLLGLALIRRK